MTRGCVDAEPSCSGGPSARSRPSAAAEEAGSGDHGVDYLKKHAFYGDFTARLRKGHGWRSGSAVLSFLAALQRIPRSFLMIFYEAILVILLSIRGLFLSFAAYLMPCVQPLQWVFKRKPCSSLEPAVTTAAEVIGKTEDTHRNETACGSGVIHPSESDISLQNHADAQVQLFVQIDGTSTPVQVNRESTIKSAVYTAMSKIDCKMVDFCVKCDDRLLDLGKSLAAENIVGDSTINVFRRISGGHCSLPLSCKNKETDTSHVTVSFEERINNLREDELFQERKVPAILIGNTRKSMPGRSKRGSEHVLVLLNLGRHTFKKLFEMISLNHAQDKCLGGNFTYHQIKYMLRTDNYIIDFEYLDSNSVSLTPLGYRKDIQGLAEVLEKICKLKFMSLGAGILPAYVAHLLHIMRCMPEGAEYSRTFKAFLRNHPCMMSPGNRQGHVLEVHGYIVKFQPHDSQIGVYHALGGYKWHSRAARVQAFAPILNFKRSRYYDTGMSWFNFWRNFLSHPKENESPDFTMEDADLALYYHFGEYLAELLCNLACMDHFKSCRHDLADVFGRDSFCPKSNEVAEEQTLGASAGGQKGGGMVQRSRSTRMPTRPSGPVHHPLSSTVKGKTRKRR
ncbi:hypothetical protein ZWY2020_044743 [Hordeum vulgare]|nr:hypothetical protein ZWY2020_044743 [Hordeum vulgare]